MTIVRGYHWSVQQRAKLAEERKNNLPFRGAIFSKVVSPAAEAERVNVESFIGNKVINYAYPFASANAWIRGQPEAGTTMLAIVGGDSNDLQPIGYYDATKSGTVASYQALATELRSSPTTTVPRTQPYRVLTPGDIDMGSNFAQTFMGLKDVHQSRGGLSHFTMTSQKATLETPLFEVHGPAYSAKRDLNDEMRFGVVRRATATGRQALPTLIRGSGVSTRDPLTGAPFAKELTTVLNWFGLPGKLLDHRQGIVVDDFGDVVRGLKTNQELRAKFQWFTLADATRVEVDNQGNWYLGTALESTQGGIIEVPTGNILVDVGQRATVRAKSDVDISSLLGRLTASATTGFRVSTPANGEVDASASLFLKSLGTIRADTPIPLGVQLGTAAGVKYPVLVGHPTYLTTQSAWHSSEVAVDNLLATYGAAAASAWAAIGPLTMLLDPTGTVATLCLNAAAAAGALATGATAASTALGAHMPTISPMPGGNLSSKTISE
jgi:hypothetical protein